MIPASAFYYWRSRFDPAYKRTSLNTREPAHETGSFVPVELTTDEDANTDALSNGAVLYYPNGCCLRLHNADIKLLRTINETMGIKTC